MRLPKFIENRRQKRRRSTDQVADFANQLGAGLKFQGELRGTGMWAGPFQACMPAASWHGARRGILISG